VVGTPGTPRLSLSPQAAGSHAICPGRVFRESVTASVEPSRRVWPYRSVDQQQRADAGVHPEGLMSKGWKFLEVRVSYGSYGANWAALLSPIGRAQLPGSEELRGAGGQRCQCCKFERSLVAKVAFAVWCFPGRLAFSFVVLRR